jgi:hypothetical protein
MSSLPSKKNFLFNKKGNTVPNTNPLFSNLTLLPDECRFCHVLGDKTICADGHIANSGPIIKERIEKSRQYQNACKRAAVDVPKENPNVSPIITNPTPKDDEES